MHAARPQDCFIPQDRDSGRPRGFAFVTMASGSDQAIQNLNETEFQVGWGTPCGCALAAVTLSALRDHSSAGWRVGWLPTLHKLLIRALHSRVWHQGREHRVLTTRCCLLPPVQIRTAAAAVGVWLYKLQLLQCSSSSTLHPAAWWTGPTLCTCFAQSLTVAAFTAVCVCVPAGPHHPRERGPAPLRWRRRWLQGRPRRRWRWLWRWWLRRGRLWR